jgi:hypothetical protein
MTITEKSSPQATAGKTRIAPCRGGKVDGPDCPARVGVEPATIRPLLETYSLCLAGDAALKPVRFPASAFGRSRNTTPAVIAARRMNVKCACHADAPKISERSSCRDTTPLVARSMSRTRLAGMPRFCQLLTTCGETEIALARSERLPTTAIARSSGVAMPHYKHRV